MTPARPRLNVPANDYCTRNTAIFSSVSKISGNFHGVWQKKVMKITHSFHFLEFVAKFRLFLRAHVCERNSGKDQDCLAEEETPENIPTKFHQNYASKWQNYLDKFEKFIFIQ
jgi:hypothetical protein